MSEICYLLEESDIPAMIRLLASRSGVQGSGGFFDKIMPTRAQRQLQAHPDRIPLLPQPVRMEPLAPAVKSMNAPNFSLFKPDPTCLAIVRPFQTQFPGKQLEILEQALRDLP